MSANWFAKFVFEATDAAVFNEMSLRFALIRYKFSFVEVFTPVCSFQFPFALRNAGKKLEHSCCLD